MHARTETRSHIGVGLYSFPEVSRLVGVPVGTLRAWIDERTGLVPRRFEQDEKLLSFVELIEVYFIHAFRNEGVSLQTIRRASAAAAKKFKTTYPFSVRRFDTDGRTLFATLIRESDNKAIIEDLKHGQLVFEQVLKPFFRKLEYKTGGDLEVARFWPREKSGRIVLDPTRKFGKPIDAATGISSRAIYDAVTAGGGQEPAVVARWLGIPVAAVKSAIEFELSLVA